MPLDSDGDFVNFEDLPVQSLGDAQLLTKVRLCAYIYKGECVPL